ncbi:unnamed protein product [Hermetia illucens]|uniref:Poly(A) polymerase n=1 Tax=Hermetia illucens TaxID=343691 RepID=A0A7R8YY77_HERIL|nr:poly(A) polymerase type 3-like [Hermetia illucens]CAD7088682.1 unnamed protein product [Hermetia illucens]
MWKAGKERNNTKASFPLSANTKTSAKPVGTRKTFGMTSAISWDDPTSDEIRKTNELNKLLESYGIFETAAESNHRAAILEKLSQLVKQWIHDVALSKNILPSMANKLGGKVFAFGSYLLGVHHRGADIDALCVAPYCIEKSDFFRSLFEILKAHSGVTKCLSIEEAFVPVIKMNFEGVEIDLLFSRLDLETIPDDIDLQNDKLLRYLDPQSMRSLNGRRVTEKILKLVPNVDTFRSTLRAIKLWAKSRGIYSNSVGYFGGVTWAMLVARVCQLYPNAAPATIIQKFFLIFSMWKWPLPVLLTPVDDADMGHPVWDPRVNLSDRSHLMPIITPSYPQQNSTFNVTESTRKVIADEFQRGKRISLEIMQGKSTWDQLLEPPQFFYKYRHFIALLANSNTAEDHLKWCGFVEAKLRLLVGSLDRNPQISLAHVHPKCFDMYRHAGKQDSTPSFCSMWFIGLEVAVVGNSSVNLSDSIQGFVTQVHSQAEKMVQVGMKIEARYVKRKQLNQYLDPEILKRERRSTEQQTVPLKRKSNEISTQLSKKSRTAEMTIN